MGVYLRVKFQVSSISLTIFRQREGGKRTPKNPTKIFVKGNRKSIIKMELYKISKLVNNSTVSTFVKN